VFLFFSSVFLYGNEDNFALFFESEEIWGRNYNPNYVGFLEETMFEYTNADEENSIKADSVTIRREKIRYNLSKYMGPAVMTCGLFLLVGGLSVGMREGVFSGRESENWMGTVNGFLTLAGCGMMLGFIVGENMRSGWDAIGAGIVGSMVGFVVGAAVSFIPPIRHAFTNNPVLYYLPTAISGLAGAGVIIFRILR